MWQKKASPTTKDADTESGDNLVRAALERGNDYASSIPACTADTFVTDVFLSIIHTLCQVILSWNKNSDKKILQAILGDLGDVAESKPWPWLRVVTA